MYLAYIRSSTAHALAVFSAGFRLRKLETLLQRALRVRTLLQLLLQMEIVIVLARDFAFGPCFYLSDFVQQLLFHARYRLEPRHRPLR